MKSDLMLLKSKSALPHFHGKWSTAICTERALPQLPQIVLYRTSPDKALSLGQRKVLYRYLHGNYSTTTSIKSALTLLADESALPHVHVMCPTATCTENALLLLARKMHYRYLH